MSDCKDAWYAVWDRMRAGNPEFCRTDHTGVECALRELDRLYRIADEPRGRIGPDTPDNDLVICPHCTSQFRAIPVNVQQELAALERAAQPPSGDEFGTDPNDYTT